MRGWYRVSEFKVLASMVLLRFLSASVEVTAALLMLRWGTVAQALRINAALGFFGPILFITVSAIGLVHLADQMPWYRLLVILAGVLLVFIGTRG